MTYSCKCGTSFKQRRYLIEHIGICNPKWPRKSPDDLHAEIKCD